MISMGRTDQEIIDQVLDSDLGRKAYESGNARRYMDRKIASARKCPDARINDWDLSAYWDRLHRAGLPAGELLVMDHLLWRARDLGFVSRSITQIEIDAATSSADRQVTFLISKGWLEIMRDEDHGKGSPRWFRLTTPKNQEHYQHEEQELVGEQSDKGELVVELPPSLSLLTRPLRTWVSNLSGHDAFRPGQHSLQSAYPALALLSSRPMTTGDLAHLLRCSAKTVSRATKRLTGAGLVVLDNDHYVLADIDPGPLLDAAGQQAGTRGRKALAIDRRRTKGKNLTYRRKIWSKAVVTPETKEWKDKRRNHWHAHFTGTPDHPLLACWTSGGASQEDVIDRIIQAELDRVSQRRSHLPV